VVISGTTEVIAPTEKVKRPRAILPEVHLHDHGARYRQLIATADGLAPIRTAVVIPWKDIWCSPLSRRRRPP
jgi:hypothetical protein